MAANPSMQEMELVKEMKTDFKPKSSEQWIYCFTGMSKLLFSCIFVQKQKENVNMPNSCEGVNANILHTRMSL